MSWIDLIKDKGPEIAGLATGLFGGVVGGVGTAKIALKKQRRVLANLQRPIMVIGTEGDNMAGQVDLLNKVDLFSVKHFSGDKACDHIDSKQRLLVVGYAANERFERAFECARKERIPILIYAKPGAVAPEGMAKISAYTFASVCNTDLRLVSDVFAVMSTFPEK